jgi:uncharacterized membrane protein
MNFVFNYLFYVVQLVLSPTERWGGARQFEGITGGSQWFVVAAIAAIIILVVLLIFVSLYRKYQEKQFTGSAFSNSALESGLTEREELILGEVAVKAGLKQRSSIFTMNKGFEQGARKLMEESLIGGQETEQSRTLRTELYILREKLGFQESLIDTGSSSQSKGLNSRQIPSGRNILITRRRARNSGEIEAEVIENNDVEFKVKTSTTLRVTPGESWSIRYYFGASVWEFDSVLIGCEGEVLVLSHSGDIRFVNRRRFLRVSVDKQGYLASFPFSRISTGDVLESLCPPEFLSVRITELAGPGLRIEAPVELRVGDRVLTVIGLEETRSGDGSSMKLVQGVGEVRHVKSIESGQSIAVELTGLKDSDVNELIRATNSAARESKSSGSSGAVESVEQPVSV